MDSLWIGIGLALMGYFIGEGLKNFKNPKGSYSDCPTLIKEKDLHYYLGLNKDEVKELLNKYPNAPKVELKGTSYYPYQQFLKWMSSHHIYKDE
ncbi:DNA-binding protein [Bacillus nakamurai]|uniref:DNA-binding protein n=1 Tax=Bacillus nakamurai TaxID=1793963 RepID=UPI001E556447|nr:DNA-binding protein [Bacillus nakamurai]MCC9021558.1 DNA-binding protein [Bacillus nakamurai]MCP6682080.1 DNA-binding protein [Bacillus nakamurai]